MVLRPAYLTQQTGRLEKEGDHLLDNRAQCALRIVTASRQEIQVQSLCIYAADEATRCATHHYYTRLRELQIHSDAPYARQAPLQDLPTFMRHLRRPSA